jgi:hypothetical protein
MSAFKTENKLSRSLNMAAVSLEIFQLTKPATVCGITFITRGMTYFTKHELTRGFMNTIGLYMYRLIGVGS